MSFVIESSESGTPPPPDPARSAFERKALGVLAIIAFWQMLRVAQPVGVGILLGALTAFVIDPLYLRIARRTHRPWVAQLACLAIVLVGVLAVLSSILGIMVARGTVLVTQLVKDLEPGGSLRGYATVVDAKLRPFGVHLDTLLDRAREAAGSVASYAAGLAATVASETFGGLLMMFFVMMTTSYVLAHGRSIETALEEMMPLARQHTRSLLAELRAVGRATLLGTVVTGLAQGALAAAVFAIVKLPEPIFFGAATAVASLLPGVGTMLVWVPAGAYLILTGHVGRGVLELVLAGGLVIGFCDYVLRPRLVGGESMPAVLTFAALFGGVEVFGLVGLIVGPIVMAIAVAVLRLYREENTRPPVAG